VVIDGIRLGILPWIRLTGTFISSEQIQTSRVWGIKSGKEAFMRRITAYLAIVLCTFILGTSITRAQDIALMKSWDPKTKFVSDDLHVQVYGNAAILSGRIIEISPTGSRDSWRWVDLFVKRDERWQILSTTQVDW
jgi:preprotein translocase subunit SecG